MGGVLKRRLSPLLRKIEAREERGVKASVGGKRKPNLSSRFERET